MEVNWAIVLASVLIYCGFVLPLAVFAGRAIEMGQRLDEDRSGLPLCERPKA